MRLSRWKPENGWRAFSTELVVVVLGVLIALGAGWWLGSQQNCRQVIIDPGIQRLAP